MRLLKFLFVLVVVMVAVGAFYVLTPYGPSQETFVDIEPGTGTAGIAHQLQNAGIIRSRYAFEAVKLAQQIAGKGSVLKAGEYRFDHPVTVSEVFDHMHRGDVYTKTVVVPEGFNIFDIAQAVAAQGLANAQDFLSAEKKDTELIAKWDPHAASLEGYLFPDTYKFSPHTTPEIMLAAMVKRFGQQMTKLGLDGAPCQAADASRTPGAPDCKGPPPINANDNPVSIARVVTMASLVEKEVHVDAERPTVAGVFENRLQAGMPLQTDPTVIYASLLNGTWTGVIHQSELHSDSPYNTYVHAGLPPGPICNPGAAALKAAMHPAKTEYLYFEANTDGSTKFAKTMEEHLGDVKSYRTGENGTAPTAAPVPAPTPAPTKTVDRKKKRKH